MSGSDLTNKLVAAGLPWLPASLLGDTIGTTISVLDYGALGDGFHDDTAAILKAATAAAGNTLLFPAGVYLLSAPILLSANTLMSGSQGATIKLASVFTRFPAANVAWAVTGANYRASPILDKNITVSGLTFDSSLQFNSHIIHFEGAQNIQILNCVFMNGGDATAMVKCDTTLVQGCSAYNFLNCAYDHWDNPTNARVIGNFAQSVASAQIVNFNANPTIASSGNTANGCVIANNILTITGSSPCTLNLNPLTSGNLTENVTVSSNVLTGPIAIVGQGNTQNVNVIGNVQSGVLTNSAIAFFGDGTDFPKNINVLNNMIVNPQTSLAGDGVIQMRCDGFLVEGNTVTGSGFAVACYAVGHVGRIGINNFAAGTSATINAPTSSMFANNTNISWLDVEGSQVTMTVQPSDFFALVGTNASGVARNIMTIQMHLDNSTLNLNPTVFLAHAQQNYVQVVGAASGSPPSISATGSPDTDIALLVDGLGNFGVALDAYVQSGAPTNTSFPAHHLAIWKNTGDGTVKLYYNDGGTLKSVALT